MQNTTADTTIVLSQVYLPLVLKRWPPVPYQPTLTVIQEADDGNYSVNWSESPSRLANTYILQEAEDATFTSELREICTTAQQSCNVSSKVAGTYYYRVRGHNNWGDSEWSNIQSANVLLPDTPTLNLIGNSDGNGNYTITWNAAARATGYILEEANNSTFNNPNTLYTGAEQTWSVSNQINGTYYYRVTATGPTGQSVVSNIESTNVVCPTMEPPSENFTLIFPIDGVVLDTLLPTYCWNPGTSTSSPIYIEIARDPAFTQNVSRVTIYSSVSGYTKSHHNLEPATTYYWRGRKRGGTWVTASFVAGSGGTVLPAPQRISPVDGEITGTTVMLQWAPVNGAESYKVRWSTGGYVAWSVELTRTQYQATVSSGRTYSWRVSARNHYAWSPNDGWWQFTVP